MYLDQVNCEQNIDFLDGRSTSLDKIDCRSYSVNEIVTKSFETNYIKIDFNDNSDQNKEGFFFLGFGGNVDFLCNFNDIAINNTFHFVIQNIVVT
jgi:hypothetical protein